MPILFETIRRYIRQFWALHGDRARSQLDQQKRAQLLDEISQLRDPAAIPSLMSGLLAGTEDVAEIAATTIQQIVDQCSPLLLAQLDATVRGMSDWAMPLIKAAEIAKISRGRSGVLGVLSFHPSGFVRQAAIEALAEANDGRELPFLLIRLNDWVKPVRDSAVETVERRIRSDYAVHIVRCLPLVYRLGEQERADHRPLVESISRLISSKDWLFALYGALDSADNTTRRCAFRALLETQMGDLRQTALRAGMESDDTVIRLTAVRAMRKELEGVALREAVTKFTGDRFAQIRRVALYAVVEKLPELAPTYLREALLDLNSSVRECAQFYFRGFVGEDQAAFYRGRLLQESGNELAAAVAGLGDTGGRADVVHLIPFLDHPFAKVRCAGVRAIARLDLDAYIEILFVKLADHAPRVTKSARNVFQHRPDLVSSARLWAMFERAGESHVRRAIISLIAGMRWWDAVIPMINASAADDPKVREKAIEFLDASRHNASRLVARPSADDFRMLHAAVERHGQHLPPAIRDDIASILAFAPCK